MQFARFGSGPPLLLLHGVGGSRRSFDPITEVLAREREIVAPDLPGFGETPPLDGPTTIATLADAIETFLREQDLEGVDCVGSSMGARLALELARRGSVGAVVALDPGGFWNAREAKVFGTSVSVSIKLLRLLEPALPVLTGNALLRTLLFPQFSARPWALRGDIVLAEVRGYANAPSFDEVVDALATGPRQEGLPRGEAKGPIVIGWGRRDLVTIPRQAKRALAAFPDARLHWFERCGHLPQWDQPEEAIRLILETTGSADAQSATVATSHA